MNLKPSKPAPTTLRGCLEELGTEELKDGGQMWTADNLLSELDPEELDREAVIDWSTGTVRELRADGYMGRDLYRRTSLA